MKKGDIKKLALLGITGGIMFTSQGEAASQGSGSDGLLAALSWTCRKGGNCGRQGQVTQACGGKSGCRGVEQRRPENGQNGNSAYNGCPGNNGCNGMEQRRPENGQYGNSAYSGCPGKNGCNGVQKPNSETKKGQDPVAARGGARGGPRGVGRGGAPYHHGGGYPGARGWEGRRWEEPGARGWEGRRWEENELLEEGGVYGGCNGVEEFNNCNNTNSCNGGNYENSQSRNASGELSEEQFVRQLNQEGRVLYQGFNEERQRIALRLAKQYADKNQAVRHAAGIELSENSSHQDNGEQAAKRRGLLS